MFRRQARQRREYIYRKSIEERERTIEEKKEKLRKALEQNHKIPTDLRKEALDLQKKLKWDDAGGEGVTSHVDDEYRLAGAEDPKIMITTSRRPSARLKQFAKELKLVFPNAQRMNRGHFEMKQLLDACRANEVTDVMIVHEHRGDPDGLIICHLPFGPTAYFSLSHTVMRHDIPGLAPASEQYPHLVFHNFKTKVGKRVMSILKYLFPVPKTDSRRVITFANEEDTIVFRHNTFKMEAGKPELSEVGPRFEMKIYRILLGTLDNVEAGEMEWELRPFMNTARKKQILSYDEEDMEATV